MFTLEEARVLGYLQQKVTAPLADVARACLPGASPDWVKRVMSELEWLGYVVIYYDPAGEPTAVQTTERGLRCPV
jgi:hypothetical protein